VGAVWSLQGFFRHRGFYTVSRACFSFDGETTATRVQVSPHRPGIGGFLPEAESLWEAH